MTSPRFVQNFRQRHVTVISSDGRALEVLNMMLMKLGLSVSYAVLKSGRAQLDADAFDPERDIIILDGDLDQPIDFPINPVGKIAAVPVIGLIGVEAPSRLKSLLENGACAFLRKPVHSATVYSALVMGVNSFQLKQQMQTTIESHKQRRHQRRSVIKAVLEIMREKGVDEDAAYDWLRRESMRSRSSIEAYSEHFVRKRAAVDLRVQALGKRQLSAE